LRLWGNIEKTEPQRSRVETKPRSKEEIGLHWSREETGLRPPRRRPYMRLNYYTALRHRRREGQREDDRRRDYALHQRRINRR
ncbi:unnamed protein product, partial [Brassica rapa]